MATCQQTIIDSGGYNNIPTLYHDTLTPFVSTPVKNQLFKFNATQYQTVKFTVSIDYAVQYYLVISFFSYDEFADTYTLISNTTIRNNNSSTFTADFPHGKYVMCMRVGNAFTQTGKLTAHFTGYSTTAFMAFNVYEGQSIDTELTMPKKPTDCNQALYYEIVEGALPPGLIMDSLGTIRGQLPNLDCLEDREEYSPAVNWYWKDFDGTMNPWGRQWRFKVKVWVDGFKDKTYDLEWFCVKIVNDWDYDRDAFIEQSPFTKIHEIRIEEPVEPLPKIMCAPCEEIEPEQIFVPKQIEERCLPCESKQQSAGIELIEIPYELCSVEPNDMLVWYEINKDIDYSKKPEVEKFISKLNDSEAFNILRQRAGYVEIQSEEDKANNDLLYIAVSDYENFLQLAQVYLDRDADPNDLAALIEMWRNHENQILPWTTFSFSGESMEIKLT